MDRRCVRVVLCALALLITGAARSDATDITTCGTTVAVGDTADLQADLVCSGFFGVRLLAGTTLRLNGHSIVGGTNTFATVLGVARINDEEPDEGGKGNFTIVGPGEIAGPGPDPNFAVSTHGCVTLQNGRATITSPTGEIDIHGCNFGIVGYILEYSTNRARATIDHVVLHDNSFEGITVRNLIASNVTAYGNGGAGVHSNRTMVVDTVLSYGNRGQGVFASSKVSGANVTVTGNLSGVESLRSVSLTNLSAIDNTYTFGVRSRRVTLVDSVVTGNNLADVASTSLPRLVNTTCGTSYDTDTQAPWGVCAND